MRWRYLWVEPGPTALGRRLTIQSTPPIVDSCFWTVACAPQHTLGWPRIAYVGSIVVTILAVALHSQREAVLVSHSSLWRLVCSVGEIVGSAAELIFTAGTKALCLCMPTQKQKTSLSRSRYVHPQSALLWHVLCLTALFTTIPSISQLV